MARHFGAKSRINTVILIRTRRSPHVENNIMRDCRSFAMASPAVTLSARLRSRPFLVYQLSSLSLLSTNPRPPSRCFPRAPIRSRISSTSMSSTAALPSTAPCQQPLVKGTQVTSASGRSYVIDEILYERSRGPLLCCLYRAR